MVGRNPLRESYYNPLGRSARERTNVRAWKAAVEILQKQIEDARIHDDAALVNQLTERLHQLGEPK